MMLGVKNNWELTFLALTVVAAALYRFYAIPHTPLLREAPGPSLSPPKLDLII